MSFCTFSNKLNELRISREKSPLAARPAKFKGPASPQKSNGVFLPWCRENKKQFTILVILSKKCPISANFGSTSKIFEILKFYLR